MEITILIKYSLLWVLHLQRLIYQVEAIISRELSYPHDVVERENNRPYYIEHYKQLLQPVDKSEFNSEYYTETPHPPRKKKVLVRKKKVKQHQKEDREENNNKKKVKAKKKKKRNRKKTVKTFVKDRSRNADVDSLGELEAKPRKPVDIIVHIKMED